MRVPTRGDQPESGTKGKTAEAESDTASLRLGAH
jgi:hypothetical protein